MNVAPQAVFQTLKAMCAGQRVAESGSTDSSAAAHTTTIATAATETKGWCFYTIKHKSLDIAFTYYEY